MINAITNTKNCVTYRTRGVERQDVELSSI